MICSQTATVLWLGGGTVSLLNIHGVSAVRQTEIHTPEPRVREPGAFELGMTIEKIKTEITMY